jgi:hypothetical protein
MSSSRWFLCVTCAIVGAIEAPRAFSVIAEDLAGPYERLDPMVSGGAAAPAVLAWTDPGMEDSDAIDADATLFARIDER